MTDFLHSRLANLGGIGLAVAAVLLQATGAIPGAGIAINLTLIAGIGISNFQLLDLRKRVERLEDCFMGRPDDKHRRGKHTTAGN